MGTTEYADEPSFAEEPVAGLTKARLDDCAEALFSNPRSKAYLYLTEERGIKPKILKACGIGWDAKKKAYLISVRDRRKRLVNVKYWWPEWSPNVKRKGRKEMLFAVSVARGGEWLHLFPTYDLAKPARILICEGEVDCMTLLSNGYAAVTSFGGAGKWDPAWGPLFTGKDVIIIPDLDPEGRKHVEVVRESVAPHASSLRVLNWGDVL